MPAPDAPRTAHELFVSTFRLLAPTALATALALAGCDRAPTSDLREWTAADHDRGDEPPQGAKTGGTTKQANMKAGGQAAQEAPAKDARALTEVAWEQHCSTCHGPIGRGDGPTGPMVKAPDLTRADFKATDTEIAQVIKNGRGKMPKFDLPDGVVTGLVGRIRAMRGR